MKSFLKTVMSITYLKKESPTGYRFVHVDIFECFWCSRYCSGLKGPKALLTSQVPGYGWFLVFFCCCFLGWRWEVGGVGRVEGDGCIRWSVAGDDDSGLMVVARKTVKIEKSPPPPPVQIFNFYSLFFFFYFLWIFCHILCMGHNFLISLFCIFLCLQILGFPIGQPQGLCSKVSGSFCLNYFNFNVYIFLWLAYLKINSWSVQVV